MVGSADSEDPGRTQGQTQGQAAQTPKQAPKPKSKSTGWLFGIGIAAMGLFSTGHTEIAVPLFWAMVIGGIVIGVRRKNKATATRLANQRTSTFPTPEPPVTSGPLVPGPVPSTPAPTPAPTPTPAPMPASYGSTETREPSAEVVARVTELRNTGRTVEAIEVLRDSTGMELYEASQYVRKLS